MKAVAGIAVVLGLAGTVLGIVALMDGGEGFDEETLELTGSNEERVDFTVEHVDKSHPLSDGGWSSHRDISGDASGEYVVTCVPAPIDDIECNGAFQLDDGDIELEGTEEAEDDGQATTALVGGTGSYEGATGEVDIDFENDTYSLHLLIPKQ